MNKRFDESQIIIDVLRYRISILEQHLNDIHTALTSIFIHSDDIDRCRQLSSMERINDEIDQHYIDLLHSIDEGSL